MARIQQEPIDPQAVLREVVHPSCGGTTLFVGTVRDNAEGRAVTSMEYSAYVPMAETRMKEIEQTVLSRWPGSRVAMVHRLGPLALNDISVAIAVATPHRAEAFEACRYAIDTLKQTVPIWKKEFGEGGAVWIEGPDRRTAD